MKRHSATVRCQKSLRKAQQAQKFILKISTQIVAFTLSQTIKNLPNAIAFLRFLDDVTTVDLSIINSNNKFEIIFEVKHPDYKH